MLERLEIPRTKNSPGLLLDPVGVICIEGRCVVEHAEFFFAEVIDWIGAYLESKPEKTVVEVRMDYMNSASTKQMTDIFAAVAESLKSGNNVLIKWFYEEDDEDIKDMGEEYQEIFGTLKFEFVAVDEI
ncbi:MAG: DUF1987 domain-containing protein [Flavobacteriales bacterium]|nr:DUF1987 domain-containing protein [Flavobacteriales bacterium]